MDTKLLSVKTLSAEFFFQRYSVEYYSMLMLGGRNHFAVDGIEYVSENNVILFLSPFQSFVLNDGCGPVRLLQFHGDFYCIEYHKKEVACNGLLFNNVYLNPFLSPDSSVWSEVASVLDKIEDNCNSEEPSDIVVTSYLQLILALCSKVKLEEVNKMELSRPTYGDMADLEQLINDNFISERNVSFYADRFSISSEAFSRKVRKEFGKTPSQLIQERVILEAKKLLHLTRKSVKEIAAELNFEDEFYFSRYFKK